MQKKKILLSDIDKVNSIKINLSSTRHEMGLTELIQRDFLDIECEDAVNAVINHDKIKYAPTYNDQSVESISYVLYKNPSTPYVYADFDFTDDDLKFRYDRFRNTFLRIQYFDAIETTSRNLLFENTLFTQDEDIDLASNSDIKFATYNAANFTGSNYLSEGFSLYWYEDAIPNTLYMTHSLNNALDGEVTPLFSYQNIPQLNQVNRLSNIQIRFSPVTETYEIVNDTKIMSYDPVTKNLEIKLFVVSSQ